MLLGLSAGQFGEADPPRPFEAWIRSEGDVSSERPPSEYPILSFRTLVHVHVHVHPHLRLRARQHILRP